jgi:hypothetical protein
MKYSATLDNLARSVTIGVIGLFIGLSVLEVLTTPEKASAFPSIPILILFPALVLGAWLVSPMSYTVEAGTLRINRPIGPVRINRADIREVRMVDEHELRGLVRTFGSGGLFGYFGKFYSRTLGHVTLYTTQRKNRVLIQTEQGKTFILSPDDPGMIDALNR